MASIAPFHRGQPIGKISADRLNHMFENTKAAKMKSMTGRPDPIRLPANIILGRSFSERLPGDVVSVVGMIDRIPVSDDSFTDRIFEIDLPEGRMDSETHSLIPNNPIGVVVGGTEYGDMGELYFVAIAGKAVAWVWWEAHEIEMKKDYIYADPQIFTWYLMPSKRSGQFLILARGEINSNGLTPCLVSFPLGGIPQAEVFGGEYVPVIETETRKFYGCAYTDDYTGGNDKRMTIKYVNSYEEDMEISLSSPISSFGGLSITYYPNS